MFFHPISLPKIRQRHIPSVHDLRANWPATVEDAIDALRCSSIPQLKIQSVADLLAGRPGRIVRRAHVEGVE